MDNKKLKMPKQRGYDLMHAYGSDNQRKPLIYGLTLLVALLYIIIGNQLAATNMPGKDTALPGLQKAEVLEVLKIDEQDSPLMYDDGSKKGNKQLTVSFRARIMDGVAQGDEVEAIQTVLTDEKSNKAKYVVSPGARVYIAMGQGDATWRVYGVERSHILLYGFLVFALLLIAFGHFKGFNTLLALLFTCGAIFLVLIPAVLSGKNIYLWTALTVVYIICISLATINGINDKTIAAGLASMAGLLLAIILMLFMDGFLQLSGLVSEESTYLMKINQPLELDIKAVALCSIILGVSGSVMEVSMDIASSLKELAQTAEGKEFKRLWTSGLAIGRDSIGTMASTLIMAFVGGSFGSVLLLVAINSRNLGILLNSEGIIVELLQMLIGAFTILFTIPFASLISSYLYSRAERREA